MPRVYLKELDKVCKKLGYRSRTDFVTAMVYRILDKEAEEKDSLEFKTAAEIRSGLGNRENLTPMQLSRRLRGIINKMLKPVIAVQGVETAYNSCLDDVREAFHEKYGIWLTVDEIREGFYQYDLLNKPELRDYALGVAHHKEDDTYESDNY
ncbi:MAG: ribbon-helix-helix domain-containing protein [Methanocorpusculum sp.]|nr:ribbon-helix-helix domain-containing protein [Methanocorpusculum sp.]